MKRRVARKLVPGDPTVGFAPRPAGTARRVLTPGRLAALASVAAVVATVTAISVFSPSVAAQPQPAGSATAAPPVTPVPANPSGAPAAPPTTPTPDTGSAAAPAGSNTGSAASAGSDAGSAGVAAPGAAGSAGAGSAGSGAGSAAPAQKPTVQEVDCAKYAPVATVTTTDGATTYTPPMLKITVNDVVKFQMAGRYNVTPNTTQSDAGLAVAPGQTKCLIFTVGGELKFHSDPAGLQGTIYAKYWFDLLAEKPIDEYQNFWLPKAVNLAADDSDLMYIAVLALSIFFFVAITAAVVYFCIKYRHRPGHKAQPSPAHNDALEITWTVIPTIIVVFLFYYGWRTYIHVVTPPNKAVEINLQAWRWNWEFKHANGVTDSDLHVPVNTPVRIVMTSRDVLHSFYAPVMRVKQDIVPRRYTYAWFYPTKPGTYRLTCAEYCGTNHSQMGHTPPIMPDLPDGRRAVVVVHEPGGYERYLADKAASQMNMAPVDLGRLLYDKKGCTQCHTIDGSPRVGPTFKQKDWGQMITMADGSKVKMDENYIQESVFSPQAKARPGFPPSMPSFEGQLKPKELEGLIAFIKSLKE